jgi:SAM-dependent methyltransferase
MTVGRVILPSVKLQHLTVDLAETDRTYDELVSDYWSTHPRFTFVKNVKPGAVMLDFGAAEGSMMTWLGWMHPVRDDVALSAIDVTLGANFHTYADYDVVDVSKTRCRYTTGYFDYVVCALALEYVAGARAALRELARVTRPGGLIYVEYPGKSSTLLPRVEEFRAVGILCEPINFFEDKDHMHLFTEESLANELRTAGFVPVTSGIVLNDRLAPELLAYGMQHRDAEVTTYGLRLVYPYISYMVARRLDADLLGAAG